MVQNIMKRNTQPTDNYYLNRNDENHHSHLHIKKLRGSIVGQVHACYTLRKFSIYEDCNPIMTSLNV